MIRKIDFHTHILSSFDDGAKTPEIAQKMLSRLYDQQVDTVVLTPHYYSHRESVDRFLERRSESIALFKREVVLSSLSVRYGAEVYYSDYLFNNKDLSPLCIDGTSTMLLELPFDKSIDSRLVDRLERLMNEYSLNLVLAHIERYSSIVKSPKTIETLLDIGCTCQVNLSSFCTFGKKRLLTYAKKGYIGALGTDCHNLDSRKPEYNKGLSMLNNYLSEEEMQHIFSNMECLLNNA